MHGFEALAILDEVGRQPVEQLRMAGSFSQVTEVAGRFDDAFAEMVLPDPVDDDARRQWVVRRGDPACEG